MDTSEANLAKSVSSWIASLAISIVCCAVLFVVFAQYVVDIKKNVAAANEKLSIMDQRETVLLDEIKSLHHMVATNMAATAAAQQAATSSTGVLVPAPSPASTETSPLALAPPAQQPTPVAVPPSQAAVLSPAPNSASAPSPIVLPAPTISGTAAPHLAPAETIPAITVPTLPAKK